MITEFIEFLKIQHKRNVEKLDTKEINLDYLIQCKIIEIEGEEIVGLDTTLIGAHYLYLNYEPIEKLKSLKRLTLGNVFFSQLDCSNFPNLEKINFISCIRGLELHIGKNEKLEEFDFSNIVLEGEDIGTTTLCVHADQIGTIVPKDIESQCKNSEGYLILRLAAAPANSRVEADKMPDKFIWQYEESDLGDVLAAYWRLRPEYYTKYASLEEAASHETENFKLILNIEKKVTSNYYQSQKVPFDISYFEYEKLSDREFHDAREIPKAMFEKIPS